MGVPVRTVENANPRFNREDYSKLREYVDYALRLPVVLPAVELFVGYKSSVAGLTPPDLQSLFKQVRENAQEWEPAENTISVQAAALASISSRIVRHGEALLDAIRSMDFYVLIRSTVGQDPAGLPIIQIPDEALSPADAAKKAQLAGQLEALKTVNQEPVGDTAETMRQIASFRGDSRLEPVVAARRQILQKSGLEKIGNETTVEPMIASLRQEYDRAVQTEGRDAAVAQAKRNALEAAIQQLQSQIDVYRDRQRLTYALGRLFTHFSELGLVMVDAEMSVGHLWLAWREAAAALENSGERRIRKCCRHKEARDVCERFSNDYRRLEDRP